MYNILQVNFPYIDDFSEERTDTCGTYLFDNETNAHRYLDKYTMRIKSFGIKDIYTDVFQTNDSLSHISKAQL